MENDILNPRLITILQSQEDLLRSVLEVLRELLKRLASQSAGTAAPAGGVRLLDSFDLQALLKISSKTLLRINKKKELVPARIAGRNYYLESDILKKFGR